MTTHIVLEQLDNEIRHVLLFVGWIGENCVQLLELLERNIESRNGLRLIFLIFASLLSVFLIHSNYITPFNFLNFFFNFLIKGQLRNFVMWVISFHIKQNLIPSKFKQRTHVAPLNKFFNNLIR